MEIHIQSFTIPHFPSLMIAMSKPAYLAILEYSPTKPVIVFVPSRRQCRLTVDDLLTHCAADDEPDRFLNLELEKLEKHLAHVRDKELAETLKHGIGFFHEALDRQDKRIVQRLFESGAIQVLIASKVSHSLLEYRFLFMLYRILRGACPLRAIWSSSWVFNRTKAKNIDTLIIQLWMSFR